jgi:hypothetical protein
LYARRGQKYHRPQGPTQMIDKYAIGVRQKHLAERVKNIWGK